MDGDFLREGPVWVPLNRFAPSDRVFGTHRHAGARVSLSELTARDWPGGRSGLNSALAGSAGD